MTNKQLLERIAALEAQLAARRNITFKVSPKGGVSVYGINSRFPVTLYADQWERLIAKSSDLLAFIKANNGSLSRKTA